MPTYKAPVSDAVFLLRDVFDYGKYANTPGFSEAPIDVVEAVLSEGAKFVEEVIQPLNRVGDTEGCKRHDDGSVATPKGFKQAYRSLVEGGWVGLAGDPAYGGQGLPMFVGVLFGEYECSANLAFSMYPGLTRGAVAALMAHGDDALKALYLPKLTVGEWAGTMNLTEPHCGTDLGLIKTKAVPQSGRLLRHNRAENLHLGRRARPYRQHRSPRARTHRGRAGGNEGHLALPRAEILA